MEVFTPDRGSYQQPCQVRLEPDAIRLEYEEDGVSYAYAGQAQGDGHYHLKAEGFDGSATLHAFAGSIFLDGAWKEEGGYGMWRIRLGGSA
jgi:hypothetical protein